MTNAPDVRVSHTAVWTGTEMVVWGGFNSPNTYRNTGGRSNPGTGQLDTHQHYECA